MRLTIFALLLLILCSSTSAQVKAALVKQTASAELQGNLHVQFQTAEETHKSVTLAVMYSLLLPGMGELYAENFSTGKYYLMAEAGLWLTYGGFQAYGNWLRQDARLFATHHANTSLDGKDDQFEVNIGNFNSVLDYNEAKLRNRQYDQLYDQNSAYAWRWDSGANRLQFKNLRIRSDEVFQNSKFIIGALVLNRIISAFSAGRSAAAYNRALRAEGGWRLDASVAGGLVSAHGIELRIAKEF